MNKPPDETFKQGRNRSWLLVKVQQTEEARCPLYVILVLIEMLSYSSYLYQNLTSVIISLKYVMDSAEQIIFLSTIYALHHKNPRFANIYD